MKNYQNHPLNQLEVSLNEKINKHRFTNYHKNVELVYKRKHTYELFHINNFNLSVVRSRVRCASIGTIQ